MEFNPEQTLYLSAWSNYTHIHHVSGKKETLAITIKKVLLRFPGFVRIHRATVVNPIFIAKISGKKINASVILTTGEELTISRRQYSRAKNAIKPQSTC